MCDESSKDSSGPLPEELTWRVAGHVAWVFRFYDPDAPFSVPGYATDGPDLKYSEVFLDDGKVYCNDLEARESIGFSVEECVDIWRARQDSPVSEGRVQRVLASFQQYVTAKQAEEAGVEAYLASAPDEEDDDEEELCSVPGNDTSSSDDDSASEFFKRGDEKITAYQVRLILRAEGADPEEREEILEKVRMAECERWVPRPDSEEPDQDTELARTAALQERQRLLRELAKGGANMEAEERARLTVQLLRLGGSLEDDRSD